MENILIVDDNKDLCDILTDNLASLFRQTKELFFWMESLIYPVLLRQNYCAFWNPVKSGRLEAIKA
jgi:hypothetical protein